MPKEPYQRTIMWDRDCEALARTINSMRYEDLRMVARGLCDMLDCQKIVNMDNGVISPNYDLMDKSGLADLLQEWATSLLDMREEDYNETDADADG